MGEASMTRRERGIEIIAATILSITTILTAWTAFESSKWSGVQAIEFSQAGATRTESVKFSNQAASERNLDVGLFTQWARAVAEDNTQLSDFLRERFRDELKPAVDAWIATEPLTNENAPPSPFAMPEYRLEADDRAAQLEKEADAHAAAAREANQRSDNYVLTTVLFAVVLFFVGIGTKFESLRVQGGLLVLATIGLVSGVAVVLTFPIEI
jgi:hypothetical protein